MSADSQELPLEESKAKPHTTAEINRMLWERYTERGEYVVLFDVPDVIGTEQHRRCDAVALGVWNRTGRLIHGFEVKASRADWLREVRDVRKADPFIEQCDRWWLVTGGLEIARPEEIPEAWGWLNATKHGLRQQRPAKPLHQDPVLIKRLWAFALIRRAAERNQQENEAERIKQDKFVEEVERRAKESARREIERSAPELAELRKRVAEFEEASGMKLGDWRLGDVGALARAIHNAAADGYRGYAEVLKHQVRELEGLQERLHAVLAAIDSPALGENDR